MFHRIDTVRKAASAKLPTRWGEFRILGFERDLSEAGWPRRETAVALIMGDIKSAPPLLRIHSQCLTGDIFGSLRCDCGKQLEEALSEIAQTGSGILIYEQQEGRGIGLISKLLAYEQQDLGADTVEANERLGLKNDYRDYSFAVGILQTLGIFHVRLLSDNSEKMKALTQAGIEIDRNRMDPRPERARPSGPVLIERKKSFTNVEACLAEIRAGRMVVVIDDRSRENEGDLTMAAEMVTSEAINFMTQHGRGLVCLALTPERTDYLRLAPMSAKNTSRFTTAFTESIDAIGRGTTTGISAYDRAQTILAALDPTTRPTDLARPGHVFPLRARKGGVLARAGHTEASVDLAGMAGLARAGVICEILNPDGSMARPADLAGFASRHCLRTLTIAELVRYRSLQQQHSGRARPIRAIAVNK
ncbi:MAG TPA: 3,4-dihydroxy-2-butanone-4-phosphate synthase [Bryobacteraceae bacterium]